MSKHLPRNGQPVTSRSWARQDEAFVNIVENIRVEVEKLEEEQRQQQQIREQQKAAIFASINRFFSNQSFGRFIRDINLPTRSVGIAASVIAVVGFVKFCSPSSETQVENLLTQGKNKFERGDYQAANEDYTKAMKINSRNLQAYLGRGKAHFYLQDDKAAAEDYTKAIKIDPKNIEAYIGRGNARSYLKNYKAAIQDYTRVISLSPESANAYMNRAVIRCTLGDKQGTIKDYQKAANLYAKQGGRDKRKQVLNRLKNLQQCGARSSNRA
ncbi:MAG: tetratricopeptide repeat protein [Spirirestis rafaelensis WJT71-NPBG6]|nr:tetratricopeptide repeat protein [Spirirestis rafaelensis WJT71-NPBG6]